MRDCTAEQRATAGVSDNVRICQVLLPPAGQLHGQHRAIQRVAHQATQRSDNPRPLILGHPRGRVLQNRRKSGSKVGRAARRPQKLHGGTSRRAFARNNASHSHPRQVRPRPGRPARGGSQGPDHLCQLLRQDSSRQSD